jgi:hypothetical protein
MEELM